MDLSSSSHPDPPPPALHSATNYFKTRPVPLPISEMEPPPLPPPPHDFKFEPPHPNCLREPSFIEGVTDPELIAHYRHLRSLSLKPVREWTIEELKFIYAKDVVTINRIFPNKISPDQIDMHLRILHRYLVLLQETNGFDIDVRPALGGLHVCLIPTACSPESHPESYHMFEELVQIVLSEFAVDYHLKTVDRVNESMSPRFRTVYITFRAVKDNQEHKVPRSLDTQDKRTPLVQIFRAIVVVDVPDNTIRVKSCKVK